MPPVHPGDFHKSLRSNWLRAAVLGVNDGVVSTASLMLGVAGAAASESTILTAGIAGLTAGALSMAIGEYVSVSSQKDAEKADIALEKRSLLENPEAELRELAIIYENRGLSPSLAREVAEALHQSGAVAAHVRDELGIEEGRRAQPVQAAVASALAFSLGSIFPIMATVLSRGISSNWLIVAFSVTVLAVSGALGAYLGGGNKAWAATRVLVGGTLAMLLTYLIGRLVGREL